ncbi:uncharacterized protein V6R79_005298 [Siganus canaliculatus]
MRLMAAAAEKKKKKKKKKKLLPTGKRHRTFTASHTDNMQQSHILKHTKQRLCLFVCLFVCFNYDPRTNECSSAEGGQSPSDLRPRFKTEQVVQEGRSSSGPDPAQIQSRPCHDSLRFTASVPSDKDLQEESDLQEVADLQEDADLQEESDLQEEADLQEADLQEDADLQEESDLQEDADLQQ